MMGVTYPLLPLLAGRDEVKIAAQRLADFKGEVVKALRLNLARCYEYEQLAADCHFCI